MAKTRAQQEEEVRADLESTLNRLERLTTMLEQRAEAQTVAKGDEHAPQQQRRRRFF